MGGTPMPPAGNLGSHGLTIAIRHAMVMAALGRNAMTIAIGSTTAVGYLRVSTPGQVGERHVSLDVQQAAFQQYCQTHLLHPIATFTDVASGRKDDRAQYQAMLRYIVEHDVGSVVVLFLDRFGRNPREILRRYWELDERGISVQSVNEDLKEELLLLVRAGIAGAESKRTGERVKAAMHRAAEKGRHMGRPPYGYAKVYEGKEYRLVQVPEEVEALRLAYRLAVEENFGYRRIANELNRRGYRGKAESGSKLFARETVKVILANHSLKGDMVYGAGPQQVVKSGIYPAILTAEEWEKLQQRLAIHREGRQRGKVNTSPFLLSGSLLCGACGRKMTGVTGGAGKGKRGYYMCSSRRDKGLAWCDTPNRHRAERLEAAVLEYLGQYSDPDKVRELLQAQDTQADSRQEEELARVTARLKELESGMLNDLDRLDRHILNEAEYVKRQEVRRIEQATLEPGKKELEASIAVQRDREVQAKAVPVRVRSFLEDFQGMDVVKAKAILQTILKAAHVWRDGRIELQFRG